jgi:hypothetical protein
VETVSRYAANSHGADVVEIVARVRKPTNHAAGARVRYPIVQLASAPAPTPAPPTPLQGLTQSVADLPAAVTTLLSSSSNLRLEGRDVFGHVYRLDLLSGANPAALLKNGQHRAQVRVSGTMMPVAPVSGGSGTLPHLFGAHAYIGTWAGEPVVSLDLRIHNGHDGHDKTTTADDPLGKVYFERLELHVPAGYRVYQAFEAPGTGAMTVNGPTLQWQLVEPLPGNKLHVMPSQGQFHRRLAIAPPTEAARAQAILGESGLAFARRGTSPSGKQTWSWWNSQTGRWFPQNFPLPHLEHVGMNALRQSLANDFQQVLGYYTSGLGVGNYPVPDDRMGWAHPWGISYGGMTGGTEINLVDGVSMVESASRDGYRRAQLVHLMQTDRQANVLYNSKHGRPTALEDWLVQANPPYMPFQFFMKLIGPNDPFGLTNPPTFQHAAAASRAPAFEATLLSYQAHDHQHLIRYTRSAKVLAWAGNDSLAKDDIWMQAELGRLTYHRHPNNQWGYADATGLLADMQHAQSWPGRGVDFGRGEAWLIDTVTTSYALNQPSWRTTVYPWFSDVVSMASTASVPCTGHLLARVYYKMLDGKYTASQSFEDAIVHNALQGIAETVYLGQSASLTILTRDTLVRSLRAFIGPLQWNTTLKGPKDIFAIGPPTPTQAVWCSAGQQPADGQVSTINTFQTFSSFGYAYALTFDPIFFTRFSEMVGGNAVAKLYQAGANNVENRAAILALTQFLLGEIR